MLAGSILIQFVSFLILVIYIFNCLFFLLVFPFYSFFFPSKPAFCFIDFLYCFLFSLLDFFVDLKNCGKIYIKFSILTIFNYSPVTLNTVTSPPSISRTFSSSQIKTQQWLNSNSPFPLPQLLATIILLSISSILYISRVTGNMKIVIPFWTGIFHLA